MLQTDHQNNRRDRLLKTFSQESLCVPRKLHYNWFTLLFALAVSNIPHLIWLKGSYISILDCQNNGRDAKIMEEIPGQKHSVRIVCVPHRTYTITG